ncbi:MULTISPECIES: zinc-finger domain-containing protein [Legionella]|uniref:Zinc-finger domain-containing protein n=1 Tax=Legionella septentrionalis TaxID=2498109 RepID=A0A3S0VBJ2_9GAMM|nr:MULTISPECIES: zinc-finger domain-containing protein [Legionella]MCP0914579.1 zinc-finger domain-containing protein [Legionella sp. 27cVA30]RUQ90038.1 zinc-finger domain-containing protein [Legionella septentrionalis]RUQ95504.1 zinc-finger domain-containing protein [Legionella septentrionalis]RUR11184.1 zinc-finger domain-containing protein [Legionella septentrionalis]RUR14363.1 zinc-finger domain-containing protein [Legionella septentrionalis]
MSEPVKKEPACTEKNYVVYPHELPLSCPTDKMELWNAHPKVYLPIERTGVEVCPYCGARFVLHKE